MRRFISCNSNVKVVKLDSYSVDSTHPFKLETTKPTHPTWAIWTVSGHMS
jgi:hypothetical protein